MKSLARVTILTILFSMLLILAQSVFAQQQEQQEMVSVPKAMLSKAQLEQIAADDIKRRVEQYGKWVGVGHEVGVAVNEGLQAVNTQSNAFANTKVGKWTIFIIVWKVIGETAVMVLFTITVLVVCLPLWIWSYRKYLPRAVKSKEIRNEKGKVVETQYQTINVNDDMSNAWRIAHCVFLPALLTGAAIVLWNAW